MTNFINWFETFIEEKEIPFKSWDITDADGVDHYIDNEVIVEAIKTAPAHEQASIKNTLVKIDFMNGDVNHFFKHLAGGLVANY